MRESEMRAAWIMISAPYSTGARTDADRAANLRAMNAAAYEIFQRGHVPVIGVSLALPIIKAAGSETFDAVMMPVSLALAERCDAVLRIGGASKGADEEVERFRARGCPVFTRLEDVPFAPRSVSSNESSSDSTPWTIRDIAAGEAAGCERVLRALPDWFGIEEALRQYIAELPGLETLVAIASGEIVGFLGLRRHNAWTAEIHVMGVRPEFHGRGIGSALVNLAEARLRSRAAEFLQVKTLGPSRPSEHYERTRRFYERMGFRPLEENQMWGPVNPCLIMVKHLGVRDPGAARTEFGP